VHLLGFPPGMSGFESAIDTHRFRHFAKRAASKGLVSAVALKSVFRRVRPIDVDY
jgi:hypothetical protein